MSNTYRFDEVIERRGTNCVKYDSGMQRKGRDDLLPLWVADMDFKLPEEILSDLRTRINHGIFGYADTDTAYFAALDAWFFSRHGYHVEPETVTVSCGIVYALAACVRAFTQPGDSVIIQQPVYYPFRGVIEENGRRFINNGLVYNNTRYSIDFDDFEQKIIDYNVKLYLCCNPHNPVGRVWQRAELEKLADICLKHNVIFVADEIHCDFVFKGNTFTSLMTLDKRYHENLAVLTSPGKTFNIAGLQPGNTIIENKSLRKRYRKVNAAAGYSCGNVMAIAAVKSVYTKGAQWVDELVEYIHHNVLYVKDFVRKNLSKAILVEPEGTYLLWIDFSGYGYTDDELEHIITDEAKLWLDSGKIFGDASVQFERFNIACPRATVVQCFEQLKKAIDNHTRAKT